MAAHGFPAALVAGIDPRMACPDRQRWNSFLSVPRPLSPKTSLAGLEVLRPLNRLERWFACRAKVRPAYLSQVLRFLYRPAEPPRLLGVAMWFLADASRLGLVSVCDGRNRPLQNHRSYSFPVNRNRRNRWRASQSQPLLLA